MMQNNNEIDLNSIEEAKLLSLSSIDEILLEPEDPEIDIYRLACNIVIWVFGKISQKMFATFFYSDYEDSQLLYFKEIDKMNDKGVVVFSSLYDILKTATDAEFPKFPDSIGLLVQNSRTNVITISTHTPRITSLVEGEKLDEGCNQVTLNEIVKNLNLDLAKTCRLLASHLLDQANRLEKIANNTQVSITDPVICKPRTTIAKTPDIVTSIKEEAEKESKRSRLAIDLFAD